mmetsp:Transcript_77938/g.218443  ORF Transcript_77938/g.218443 Transcript_77938/m.218443 type:complete len:209 (+) Transcript_77938:238-864(+)
MAPLCGRSLCATNRVGGDRPPSPECVPGGHGKSAATKQWPRAVCGDEESTHHPRQAVRRPPPPPPTSYLATKSSMAQSSNAYNGCSTRRLSRRHRSDNHRWCRNARPTYFGANARPCNCFDPKIHDNRPTMKRCCLPLLSNALRHTGLDVPLESSANATRAPARSAKRGLRTLTSSHRRWTSRTHHATRCCRRWRRPSSCSTAPSLTQ